MEQRVHALTAGAQPQDAGQPLAKLIIAIAMFLAVQVRSVPCAWASSPPPLRGTVTCNGRPVYHALVQGLADAASLAPLGEAYTDRSGRFELTVKPGATVATAYRELRDTGGELRKMSATPRPLGTKSLKLSLDRREVRSLKLAATAEDLQLCPDGEAKSDTAQLEAAVADLLSATPEQRTALIEQHRALLRAHEGEGTQNALETAFKRAEATKQAAAVDQVGQVAAAVGQQLALGELHAVGLAWQAVARLYDRRAMAAGRLVELSPLTWLQALMAQQSGQADAAISLYRRAIEEGELVRSSLASDTHKVGVLESTDEALYGALELLLVDQGKPGEALEVSEQRRARALLDVLATGELRKQLRRGGPSQELQQLAERMQALAAQDQQLDLHLGTTSVTRVDPQTGRARAVAVAAKSLRFDRAQGRREAEVLWQQLGQARQKVAGSTAEVASLVTAPLVGVQEIRAFAQSRDAVLVEWSVHADVLLIYVVQRDGRIDVAKVRIKAQELQQLVRQARQNLGAAIDRDPKRGAEAWGATAAAEGPADPAALAKLSALLVAPIAQWLPSDPAIQVVAAPHRSLLLLPLAALPLADGRPWLESAALSVVPSLGVLRYTAAKAKGAAKSGALVVGNPAMPRWQGAPLPPLPGAEREAAAVAKALEGAGVALLTGAKATESRVREALAGKRWLHLATHGVALDDRPGESFVALAADGKADGLLSVGEVLGLQLQADLVVLSACQTGLGKVSGDGVLGLGRAFLYAGTPRVVVSLWSVPDEATALLMGRLYAGLAKGLAPAEALRQAQLATRKRYADPLAWAAFELVGEGN